MQIIEKSVNSIKPYLNNPRNNASAVSRVAASIREFGFRVPIVLDKDDVIAAGHTRLLAALELGLETVPCVVADDLTEEQIKAFRLADNKVAEFAEWDADLLLEEMQGIDEIDMSEFGFDLSVFEEPDEIVEDDFEGVERKEPRAKKGDIWQLGEHRLMCGDSLILDDVENVVGGGQDRSVDHRPALWCFLHGQKRISQ